MSAVQTRFHMTDDGPRMCRATKRQCPLLAVDPNTQHFDTLQEAMTAFDAMNSVKSHGVMRKGDNVLLSKLLAGNKGMFPVQTLRELDALIKFTQRRPLAIVPSGSVLYNSQIPGRITHDYDFVVFAEPFGSRQAMEPMMNGTLDTTFVDIRKLPDVITRSSAISEAFFGFQHGRALAQLDSPWKSYLDNMSLNENKYLDLINDTINSQKNQYVEPVSMDDKDALRSFKHVVRWNLYQKRWGSGRSMDPRLDDSERKLFLRALEAGRLDAINH